MTKLLGMTFPAGMSDPGVSVASEQTKKVIGSPKAPAATMAYADLRKLQELHPSVIDNIGTGASGNPILKNISSAVPGGELFA